MVSDEMKISLLDVQQVFKERYILLMLSKVNSMK